MALPAPGHKASRQDLGPQRWIGGLQSERKERSPETVSPPGALWSKPKTPRAGRHLGLADLRLFGLRSASVPRGAEARGSGWTHGVPRALGIASRAGGLSRRSPQGRRPAFGNARLTPGRIKNRGDDARLLHPSLQGRNAPSVARGRVEAAFNTRRTTCIRK